MNKFQERRRCERVPLAQGVEVGINDVAVATKDVSSDGLGIVANEVGVEPGDIVNLTINIERKPNIYLKATVMRVEESGFGLKINKKRSSMTDLARFYQLVRKCRQMWDCTFQPDNHRGSSETVKPSIFGEADFLELALQPCLEAENDF